MQLPFVRLLVSKISKEQANLRSHLRTINAVFILVCLYCTDDKWPKTFDLCLMQSKIPGMDTHNHSGLQKKKKKSYLIVAPPNSFDFCQLEVSIIATGKAVMTLPGMFLPQDV